jgi:choline-sulfatase
MRPVIFALLCSCAHAARPNIIWLQADSMDGRLMDPASPYNSVWMMTGLRRFLFPNAVTFSRHYTNSPQCVPSRTSMLTSRYVHETGTSNNGQGFAANMWVPGALDESCVRTWNASQCAAFAARQNTSELFLNIAQRAGYELFAFGRFDAGGGILETLKGDTSGDGFHGGPNLGILCREANIPGTTKSDPWEGTSTNEKKPYDTDSVTAAAAVKWLQQHDPSKGPWMMWAGFLDPHPDYQTNATYIAKLNQSALFTRPLPALKDMHPFDRGMSISKNLLQNYTEAQMLEMRTAYWGAYVEALEDFYNVLYAAQQTGHLNNTVVIITSDHGEMSVEHRQDFKNSLREPSTRVPMVVASWGVPEFAGTLGSVVTNLTSHIDVLPTIAELVGAPLPAYARGASMVPFLQGGGHAGARARLAARKPYVAIEYHSNMGSAGSYSLRNDRYKVITFGRTWPWFNASTYTTQLFDVVEDPWEERDVAAQHPDVVAAMLATLEQEWGGPGSIAAIDKERSDEALALYNAVRGRKEWRGAFLTVVCLCCLPT